MSRVGDRRSSDPAETICGDCPRSARHLGGGSGIPAPLYYSLFAATAIATGTAEGSDRVAGQRPFRVATIAPGSGSTEARHSPSDGQRNSRPPKCPLSDTAPPSRLAIDVFSSVPPRRPAPDPRRGDRAPRGAAHPAALGLAAPSRRRGGPSPPPDPALDHAPPPTPPLPVCLPTRRRGSRAALQAPTALAGPASAALSFGRAAGGGADAASPRAAYGARSRDAESCFGLRSRSRPSRSTCANQLERHVARSPPRIGRRSCRRRVSRDGVRPPGREPARTTRRWLLSEERAPTTDHHCPARPRHPDAVVSAIGDIPPFGGEVLPRRPDLRARTVSTAHARCAS